MNILIITPAGRINGTAKTFLSWIKVLHGLNHKVYLFTEKGNLALWSEDICEKQFFFKNARFEPSIGRLFKITQIANSNKIDVIWGVGTTSSLLGALAGVICKIKFINILNVTPRDSVWLEDPEWKYPNVEHIVTVSDQFRKVLISQSNIPEQLCHFVPARMDLDEFKPEFPAVMPKEKLNISLFRRFDKQKVLGVLSFLRFVEEHRDSLGHCSFKLFGGGDNEKQVIEVVNHLMELGVQISYCGFIKDIQKEMVEADIVVGSERVAIEALLCGRPICIIGDKGIVDFVTRENLVSFIGDNFSGIDYPLDMSIEIEEVVRYLNDHCSLLSKCDLPSCHAELSKRYGAKEGVYELIKLSNLSDPNSERLVKFYRIIFAIIDMCIRKMKISLARRLS